MSAKLIFTSYKDTRGKGALGQEISEALGIEAPWTGSAKEGQISLVELREGDGVISVLAHAPRKFSELVVLDAGKTILKETNGENGIGENGTQERTVVWPNGKLERTMESWSPRSGLLGDRREIAVPDEAAARQRVERIAKRVLPLARNI
jgi:hypothetical protein